MTRINSLRRDLGMTVQAAEETLQLLLQLPRRARAIYETDILLLRFASSIGRRFLPRRAQNFQRWEMLSRYGGSLDREFSVTLNDEAVEAFTNEDCHNFGHGADDSGLSFIRVVEG